MTVSSIKLNATPIPFQAAEYRITQSPCSGSIRQQTFLDVTFDLNDQNQQGIHQLLCDWNPLQGFSAVVDSNPKTLYLRDTCASGKVIFELK